MATTNRQDEFYAPFWCVQVTTKLHEANMKFEFVTVKVEGPTNGITIPIRTNYKALKAGEQLLFFASDIKKIPNRRQ